MNKSGGQTAHALAFGSVTLRPGGKFKDPVLVGVTQPRSFRSLFFLFFSPSICLPVFVFSPSFLTAIAPSSPHVSHFLPSPSLFVQTRYYNSLLALAKPAESDGGKKKTNKHKLPPLLESAVVPETLFKRDTWSIFPFHLVALPPSPFPLPHYGFGTFVPFYL